ncbi:unnamed protein product [Rotaria sordida]|uniref:Transmembrane protein 35A n=1 Tax=Rotaria sordida TaxID=392033 RepID=A0A814GHI4_9BILA|nr:unnamed protein product [Rotaria sordida]CAF0996388.1 unnamed protein product [Rotaria sordida]CAF3516304.1 unnamed protein product [Rotaria sordida]CAF3673779.1 unnamed protein product [Rotaria sordida]CAF3691944.1 unnamed protein product [Rotaria sordida]
MASLGLHLLTIVLGAIFIFLGHIKLTPQFFPEYHTQVRNEFGKLNKEFPFYHLTGWRPYAKNYRIAVGVAEMSSGTLLLLGGALSQSMANMVLLVIMISMIIAFQKLHYSMEYIGGAIFLAFLLVLRFVLASKSKAIKTAKTAKRNLERKVE